MVTTPLSPNKKYGGLLLISAVMFLGFLAGAQAAECTSVPVEECTLSVNNKVYNFTAGTYSMPDTGANGSIIVTLNNIVLQANSSLLQGNRSVNSIALKNSGNINNFTGNNLNISNYSTGVEFSPFQRNHTFQNFVLSNILVRGFNFDGVGTITVTNATFNNFGNATASNGIGIRLRNTLRANLTTNVFNNVSYGVFLINTPSVSILNSNFTVADFSPIYLDSSTGTLIENNKFSEIGNNTNNVCINIAAASNSSIIFNNAILDCYSGISATNSKNHNISGNYLSNSTIQNIYFVGTNHSQVISNVISNATYRGIYLDIGSDNTTISLNNISNIGNDNVVGQGHPIRVESTKNVTLSYNKIHSSAYGLYLIKANATVIENNNISSIYYHPMNIDNSSNNIIRNNFIDDFGMIGFGIAIDTEHYSNNVTVYNNTVTNGYSAITYSGNGGVDHLASYNYVRNMSLYGINFNAAHNSTADHNQFYQTGVRGVSVYNSTNISASNNTIMQSTGYDYFVSFSDKVVFQINSGNYNGSIYAYINDTSTNTNLSYDRLALYFSSADKLTINLTQNYALLYNENTTDNFSVYGGDKLLGFDSNGLASCTDIPTCDAENFSIPEQENFTILYNYSINQSASTRLYDPITVSNTSVNVRALTSTLTSTLTNVSVTLQTGGIVPSSPLLVHPDGSSEYPSYLYDSVSETITFNATIMSGVSTLRISPQNAQQQSICRNGTGALGELGGWLPIIALVIGAAIVLGILSGGFGIGIPTPEFNLNNLPSIALLIVFTVTTIAIASTVLTAIIC